MTAHSILFTSFDVTYAPLAKLTVPLMKNYSRRHSMDFHQIYYDKPDPTVYWDKFRTSIELLDEGYRTVMWLDCDQMITNPALPRASSEGGLHVSLDWGEDATEPWHF